MKEKLANDVTETTAPEGEPANIDPRTVAGFGEEWAAFDQSKLDDAEWQRLFERYFSIFPFDELPPAAEGFDLGCGSGRWAAGIAPRVGKLHCIDPSEKALAVARSNLAGRGNVQFHAAAADSIPLDDESQDFGYSLGVLHHIPDTMAALRSSAAKLKPGAPFLVYLYYDLEQRPGWFRSLWRASDLVRRQISRLPFPQRKLLTDAIAASVYWPLARLARTAERLGVGVRDLPLSSYRNLSFYTMRTDALDRFGTALEQRFSKEQIRAMMESVGLGDIRFSDKEPFWIACGRKR